MGHFARQSTTLIVCVGLLSATTSRASTNKGTAEDLTSEYDKAVCAIVQVSTSEEHGTGFFIDGDGDVLTAAHVASDRSATVENGTVTPKATQKRQLTVKLANGTVIPIVDRTYTQTDIQMSTHDLAMIATGRKTTCFLDRGNPDQAAVGSPVLAIGFPGDATAPVLYSGFLSAREVRTHVLGPVTNQPGSAASSTFGVLRAQMPITQGASGSPLLDANDRVLGVIIEIPVENIAELDKLLTYYEHGGGGGVELGIGGTAYDPLKLDAELTFLVEGFESPGFGFAVPVSFLPLQEVPGKDPKSPK